MKNPSLCERPYCREPWTYQIHFWRGLKRTRIGHYCDQHADCYLNGRRGDWRGGRITYLHRS